MSDVYETLYYEGEIERLKIELAEANAKIIRAENIAVSVRWYMESFLSTFESATPKPKLKAETT